MTIKSLLTTLILTVMISGISSAQSFSISEPRLSFDGNRLSIVYDIITNNKSDLYHVWVELKKIDGIAIRAKSFAGDIGDNVTPGKEKSIIWIPVNDAIFIDDDVTVEVFGERYEKSFNKGAMIAMSAILPGSGQSRISGGKPWWILSIPAYGTLAGGLINYSNYIKTYDAYKAETDPIERSDLFDRSQKQKSLSTAMFIASAVVWAGNVGWVSAIPNPYKPVRGAKLSLGYLPVGKEITPLFSLKVEF